MITFWKSWWAFAFMLSPFIIGLLGIAIFFFLTYRHYDTIAAAFAHSPGLQRSLQSWSDASFKLRYLRILNVAGLVLWPRFFIRRGQVDARDIQAFPPAIARLIRIGWWSCATGSVWLLMGVGLLKLSGVK
jgi:hypothetical protein